MTRHALPLFLALAATAATGAPVLNPATCAIAWDYSAQDEARIDGFRFFVNGAATVEAPASTRQIACADLKPTNGANEIKAQAFSGALTSGFSNALALRYSALPLPAPGKTRLVIQFSEKPR